MQGINIAPIYAVRLGWTSETLKGARGTGRSTNRMERFPVERRTRTVMRTPRAGGEVISSPANCSRFSDRERTRNRCISDNIIR
jgi:hypothetical protein